VGGTVETNEVITGRSAQAPDFSRLNFAPGSLGDTVSKAISSGDWNKTIDLPGFVTDSTGALADQAKAGVRDLASVLSAAPNVKVRIIARGETAEAGLEQASAIKSALVSDGVAEDRILVNGQTGSGVPSISLIR
jgi:outer membrane protein OmpA-like peptidoglycan-associated protein